MQRDIISRPAGPWSVRQRRYRHIVSRISLVESERENEHAVTDRANGDVSRAAFLSPRSRIRRRCRGTFVRSWKIERDSATFPGDFRERGRDTVGPPLSTRSVHQLWKKIKLNYMNKCKNHAIYNGNVIHVSAKDCIIFLLSFVFYIFFVFHILFLQRKYVKLHGLVKITWFTTEMYTHVYKCYTHFHKKIVWYFFYRSYHLHIFLQREYIKYG